MSRPVEEVSNWVYQGVWGILTRWFRVPQEPPALPPLSGAVIRTFRPAQGFLDYLKLQFWIVWIVYDLAVGIPFIVLLVAFPLVGFLLAPIAVLLILGPAAVSYLAIHLRFDTTWYVMSDRSLRIRRGIWVIHETTITFENVQNVAVDQGPIQRFFGIANVVVQTAGGGSVPGQHGSVPTGAHQGLIEGVDNAAEIRDLIMNRLKTSSTAGLGDEPLREAAGPRHWPAAYVETLREIRDAARRLAG